MASFASSATTCGARKHDWTKNHPLACLILQIAMKKTEPHKFGNFFLNIFSSQVEDQPPSLFSSLDSHEENL